VNSFCSKLLQCCLLVIATAVGAYAQPYWSLPSATPNTDVPCTGCGGTREGKLTPGYPSVLRYVGRFDDSDSETDYQEAFRVGRARGAFFAPERNRAYFVIGSALAAYNIDNFFSKVSAHASLSPASALSFNSAPRFRDRGTELFLYWDRFFYAEHVGGWNTPPQDGTDRLFRTGIDWDDRNFCYLAYTVFGWGMVTDNPLLTDGGMMENTTPIAQFFPDVNPFTVVSVKTSDGSYFALTTGQNGAKTEVWNVTDPRHAVKMADQNRSIWQFGKNSNGSRIGVLQSDYVGKIYTADALARGAAAIQDVVAPAPGAYFAMDSDGTNFYYFAKSNGVGLITVMSPNANGGYDRKDYPVLDDAGKPVPYSTVAGIRAGGGLLAIFGTEAVTRNIRLFKLTNGVPTAISLDNVVNGKHGQFFAQYYANDSPGSDYVHPDRIEFMDVTPYKYNGKTYIIVSAAGLGDVWEVKSGDSLNGSIRSVAETPNPNSQATAPGPFYGDRQTFNGALASGKATTLNWTFDDGTNGSTLAGTTEIKHQFSGISSATALPTTRHATATDASDSSITTTINVPLAKPDVRFALNGTSYLFKLPDASSTAPIVTSDAFADASDGSVEGHYSEWVLDNASTKKLPSELFSAGTCGVHALNFIGHYGGYLGTGANIAPLGSDLPLAINGFNYLSRPFVATVQPPPPVTPATLSGPAVFTAAVRMTATSADLPAGPGTAVNYRWELVGSAGTTLQQSAGTATLGTIPPYSLDRSVFNTLGSKVRLTATVAAGALGSSCAPYATSTSTTDALNAPDPTIVKSGCDNAGAPCSFSITSGGSQTGWAYAWSMTNSNATSTTATFAPTITTGGSYTVTLVVTNAIGSATRTIQINPAQPLCSSAPSIDNTNFGAAACNGAQCTAGQEVTFIVSAYQWNPDPACDSATWSFGDNSTGTGLITQHTYANNGTYSVTLTLKGGQSTAVITNSVAIGPTNNGGGNGGGNNGGGGNGGGGNGGGGNGGGGNGGGTCPAQTADSAYIGFLGPQTFCSASGGACNAGELITFGGYSLTYNFDCSTTTYAWDFGDGGHASERLTQHAFTTGGTHHVTLTVSNNGGTGQYSANVQVGPAQVHQCGDLSTQTVAMTFTGNNCTENGGDCVNTTPVSFAATGVAYDFNCGTHTFDWDYGDGSAHGTGPAPSHKYNGSGTYNVTLKITYGQTNFTLPAKSIKIVAPSGGGGNCPLMVADENVYMVYYGTVTGSCSSVGGACPVGENVQFKASSYNYNDFACDTHSFTWDFGDNTTSTEQNPIHKYTKDGTYHVKLTIGNKQQSIDLPKTIVVGTGVNPPVVPPRHRAAGH